MTDLVFEKIDHVGVIRLNRPDSLNAFSQEMIGLWIESLKKMQHQLNHKQMEIII